ncbi:hypothetical protein [Zunongwangia sp.]|uniref:hypothetical protein n=1 Tax=Zunongwangia sp. TaxID=1965325 RepID=UPI003AA91C28
MENEYQKGIIVNIPVKIPFTALEKAMEAKINDTEEGGKSINDYAEVKWIWLEKNEALPYDITLGLRVKAKTFLFKNKEIELKIHLKFSFDRETQKFSLEKYKAVGENTSWIKDKLVQLILNTVLHKKMLSKSKQDLGHKLQEELAKINIKLRENKNPTKGVHVGAHMEKLSISHFLFERQAVYVYMNVLGEAELEITELPS